MTSIYWLLIFLLGLMFVLYNISTVCHYYMRISFFYVCILLHGAECMILMIPSCLKSEVRGYAEHLEHLEGPAIVVCNHQLDNCWRPENTGKIITLESKQNSALDVVGMTHVWPPRGCVMMKKSLMFIPIFNITSWMGNTVFVDRFNRERAMNAVDQCVEQLTRKNLKLWVFPEGTRNRYGGLLPFKKGAFNIAIQAKIPIVPIVLSDFRPFYSKTEKYFKTDGEVIAQVLPKVETKGMSLDDVVTLSDKIRDQMLAVYNEISPEAKAKMVAKRLKAA